MQLELRSWVLQLASVFGDIDRFNAQVGPLLEALQRLSDVERKTLVLTHLAAMPMGEIAREVGVTQPLAEQHLQTATSAVALGLDTDATSIRARLEAMAPRDYVGLAADLARTVTRR